MEETRETFFLFWKSWRRAIPQQRLTEKQRLIPSLNTEGPKFFWSLYFILIYLSYFNEMLNKTLIFDQDDWYYFKIFAIED